MRYVYAILPANESLVFDVAGVDDDEDDVFTIGLGGMSAVVGAASRADFRQLGRQDALRYLIAHQRVIETVMRDYPTMLPVRFGTIVPDETRVARFLEQGEPLFRKNFALLAGRVQMEVVVTWNLAQVFAQIGAEPEIMALKSWIGTLPDAAAMAERAALGQSVKTSLDRRRQELKDRLLPGLRELSSKLVENPIMDDNMVTNLALLVPTGRLEAFDRRIAALDEQFEGQLDFRCVGPLPPYSFATIDLRLPGFEEVAEARRCLGLGEEATRSQVRRSYHEQVARIHPDLNPSRPGTEAEMTGLARAYELLMACGSSQVSDTEWSFAKNLTDQTFLISVAGQ